MSQSLIRWKLILACALLAAASPAVLAQDGIKWRTNYNDARKEAETKNLPLFIDFVRPNCPPCEKMEQYTFRDPRIIRHLNEKFVPLRINSFDDAKVVELLQINLFPTLVLADADGRNRQDFVGFKEADFMHEQLQRIVARLAPTDAMQKDLTNAQNWEATGEYSRAIGALRMLLTDDTGRPLQKSARALLEKIEKRAADSLTRARELQVKGQLSEAIESLVDTQKQFAGLQASKDALDMIGKLEQANVDLRGGLRTKRVQELLTQAQDFYRTKDYIPCLDRCEIILTNYGDLPEGQKAFKLAGEIKNNPEWLQSATDVMTDRLAGMWLALSDSYLKRGEVSKAEFYLKRVIQAFPGSRLAESAQIRLTQLQATMPRPEVQSAGP